MKSFLKKKALSEVFPLLDEAIVKLSLIESGEETISTCDTLSRLTVSPLRAPYPVPPYRLSAMDGIALFAQKTFGASQKNPKYFGPGEMVPVDTGNPIPKAYDAVVKIEDITKKEDGYLVFGPATPNENVRLVGEDIKEGGVILPGNHRIGPEDIGALLGCGLTRIQVKKKPTLAIIPTGSELISPGKRPEPGQVVEFNSQVILTMADSWGAKGVIKERVLDDPNELKEALLNLSFEYPILVTIAGSSAGRRDYLPEVLEEIGEILLHGVSIRPGKPFFMGIVGKSLLLGLPGYPVSCYLAAHLFLRYLLYRMQGISLPPLERVEALVSQDLPSNTGMDEFIRVRLGEVRGRFVAKPLPRGASLISSLVSGDGFLLIPRLQSGVLAKEKVLVERFSVEDLSPVLFISGSYNPILDSLRDLLLDSKKGVDLFLGGKRRGVAGLVDLREGLAHMASLYLPVEIPTSFIMEQLQQEEAFFLNLAQIKGEGSFDPLLSDWKGDLSYGLLFLPQEQERVAPLLEVISQEAFKDILLREGYGNEKTGTLEHIRRG